MPTAPTLTPFAVGPCRLAARRLVACVLLVSGFMALRHPVRAQPNRPPILTLLPGRQFEARVPGEVVDLPIPVEVVTGVDPAKLPVTPIDVSVGGEHGDERLSAFGARIDAVSPGGRSPLLHITVRTTAGVHQGTYDVLLHAKPTDTVVRDRVGIRREGVKVTLATAALRARETVTATRTLRVFPGCWCFIGTTTVELAPLRLDETTQSSWAEPLTFQRVTVAASRATVRARADYAPAAANVPGVARRCRTPSAATSRLGKVTQGRDGRPTSVS